MASATAATAENQYGATQPPRSANSDARMGPTATPHSSAAPQIPVARTRAGPE